MEEPRVEVGESGMTLDEIVESVLDGWPMYQVSRQFGAAPRLIDLMADYDLTLDEAVLVAEQIASW